MSTIPAEDPTTRLILRHLIATIAYRAGEMKGESYARADVVIGRVGLDQAPPVRWHEFD